MSVESRSRLSSGQRLQPRRGVVRVHPAHDGGNVADVAGRRRGAQLQVQPADTRALRRQIAGTGRQFHRGGPGVGGAGGRFGVGRADKAQRSGGGQRVGVGTGDENAGGGGSPCLRFLGRGVRTGRGRRTHGARRHECKHQQAALDHAHRTLVPSCRRGRGRR